MHKTRARSLKVRLDALVASSGHRARRAADPVEFVHRFDTPEDRELVGLVAALLAFGNVVAVRRSIARVLDLLGPTPARFVGETPFENLAALLGTFRHRVYAGEDVARLLAHAAAVRAEHGSVGELFRSALESSGDASEALAQVADRLRGDRPSRGLAHLVPDPRKGSASKRLWLFLRWMIRPDDGIDLGLWDVPASVLRIPVDTHVLRIGRNLGLTRRRDASARTSLEITESLRALDPEDPVRYDFAICHLGVSRACPSRRVDSICHACALRDVCLAYRGEVDAPRAQSRKNGASLASSRRSASRDSTRGPRSS